MEIIKRNNHLDDIMKYWNHNKPSNIGLGCLSRKKKNGKYVINKMMGRKDLALFNVSNVKLIDDVIRREYKMQYSVEPSGLRYLSLNTDKDIISFIKAFIKKNKTEIKIQVHYLKWFDSLIIEDIETKAIIKLLQSYVYNDTEAEILYRDMLIV